MKRTKFKSARDRTALIQSQKEVLRSRKDIL